MNPQPMPVRPGDCCWDQAYAEKMLSPIAQVAAEEADWFLATHSPITCNDDVGPVKQEDLLGSLLSSSRLETLVVMKGEPGTGKSQLINWLKLGFDAAIARGARSAIGGRTLRSVLVRRRSGSLKDALQQLIDQLPGYERYLAHIQAAIAGISGEAANRRLYTELQHALHSSKHTAPRLLQKLEEVFNDNGSISWLCRRQGAIDLNVKRLTEQSEATDRDSLPPFTSEDFAFPANARLNCDEDLQLRLADDEAFRDRAASRVNEHLRQAIAGLTGLRGHTLNDILREIRQEMQRKGEALALFVEDVSTLSVLDEELVNALQPLNDSTLCPLVSVLGMTEPAYRRLPDNLKGRIDRVLTLSPDSSLSRLVDSGAEGTDLFVARYLNALRSGATQVRALADDVRDGELRHSACDECGQKSTCFSAFESVSIGDTDIGLYPLSRGAARRLLAGLNTERALKTPRTLLQAIIRPLLNGMATEFRGPTVGVAIHPRSPRDVNVQEDRMLTGWTVAQRARLSYLLYYWTGHDALADGAAALAPMLPWFRHPGFSSMLPAPRTATRPAEPTPVGQTTPSQIPTPPPDADRRYRDAIAKLETWFHQGRPLQSDSDFRKLLATVVTRSLVLDDVRVPSGRTRRISAPIDASNIVIEGMIRKPAVASKARFEFARSQEVFEFLRDLVAFEHLGQRSWRFDGGQAACRRYAVWLKRHSDELVRAFDVIKCDREAAMRASVRFLHLAYRFSNRKELPPDWAAAVEAVISFNPGTVGTLSEAGRALAADLSQRLPTVRNWIVEELAVRQGDKGGINYIDPRPLIEYLPLSDDLSLGEIDVPTTMADYPEVGRLASSPWCRLSDILVAESDELRQRIASLESLLETWHVRAESVPQALRDYLESARAVVKTCEAAGESLGDTVLQGEIRSLAPAVVAKHVANLGEALEVLEKGSLSILTLNVSEVEKTLTFVARCDRALVRFRDSLAQRLADTVTVEEVEAERQRCSASIEELSRLSIQGVETVGAES